MTFEVAGALDFPDQYDLICLFDCLHDMGDPLGAARHIRQALRPGGTLLLVEPAAADRPEDNHHPLGRLFYAASTAICLPGSLAQDGQLGLGNQAGTGRLNEILDRGRLRLRTGRDHDADQRHHRGPALKEPEPEHDRTNRHEEPAIWDGRRPERHGVPRHVIGRT